MLGASTDAVAAHQDFCARQNLTFKLLADHDKKLSKLYGSLRGLGIAARNTFLIDPQGRIAKVWLGVSPASHSGEVLATLQQLAAHP